jgi:hypothetical protein
VLIVSSCDASVCLLITDSPYILINSIQTRCPTTSHRSLRAHTYAPTWPSFDGGMISTTSRWPIRSCEWGCIVRLERVAPRLRHFDFVRCWGPVLNSGCGTERVRGQWQLLRRWSDELCGERCNRLQSYFWKYSIPTARAVIILHNRILPAQLPRVCVP